MKPMSQKDYLGDGVYVNFDGCMFVLTTEDGISVTNCIFLEPEVYTALTRYVDRLTADLRAENRSGVEGSEG